MALSPISARKMLADAQRKVGLEEGWVNALASGKTCAEVFGLKAAVKKQ